jgi:predicted DNA-binding antitoxin AbrB/MazE fold protein
VLHDLIFFLFSSTEYELEKFAIDSIIPLKRRILASYTIERSAILVRSLYRPKSLTNIQNSLRKLVIRSISLPSMKFDLIENTPLNTGFKPLQPVNLTDESYVMPMIVNVEENVQINKKKSRTKRKKKTAENCPYSNQQAINVKNNIQKKRTSVSNRTQKKIGMLSTTRLIRFRYLFFNISIIIN